MQVGGLLSVVAAALAAPAVAFAQPAQPEPPAPGETAAPEGEAQPEEPTTPQLQAPMLQGSAEEEEPGMGPEAARERLLSSDEPPPERAHAEPEEEADAEDFAVKALPLLALHGYFRTRFELFQNFNMGVGDELPARAYHRPIEIIHQTEAHDRLCGETSPGTAKCSNATLAGGNLRLRLEPQINVSDEVQVNSRIDVLDNLVLGSTPEGYTTTGRDPWAPLEAFASTQEPPDERNSFTDSVAVKHAWAQVRTSLGVLRFGRMGSEWGLGLLANGGNDIDSNYGDIADRILFATRVAGITIVPIWDFASEGAIVADPLAFQGQAHDAGQLDDVNQYILVLARKLDEEEFQERQQLGLPTLQGGAYIVYRDQLLSSEDRLLDDGTFASTHIVRRNAYAWIPDLWVRFDYRKLRLEAEGVWIRGAIENLQPGSYSEDDMTVNQLGGAFQLEYRLLADKLMLAFETGYASGDEDIDAITPAAGLLPQANGDKDITNFKFDRDYYVDLIFWRNMMGAVSSAYYFRPSLAYNFIDNPFGQLFGGRLDIIWSRASEFVQTRGNHGDLAIEFDASLYYRSEDGTSREDGFVAGLQYGLMVPLAGMYNQDNEEAQGDAVDLSNAQIIRAILGVVY